MHTIQHTITRGDEDIDIDVDYEVAPYDPGRTYGPPEDCYPPEGGEITSLTAYRDGEEFALTDAEASAVEQRIYDTHDYSE